MIEAESAWDVTKETSGIRAVKALRRTRKWQRERNLLREEAAEVPSDSHLLYSYLLRIHPTPKTCESISLAFAVSIDLYHVEERYMGPGSHDVSTAERASTGDLVPQV